MSTKIILASFGREEDLLGAVRAVQQRNWNIVDVYCPYAVHGLEKALGWPRSRLPVACFLCGAFGVALALWFQFWTTAWDWPVNVGGRPWNSLPAFVPVTFESMVLLGGFGLAFAWLCRSRLYPGKTARLPVSGVTDDRFVLAVHDPSPAVGQTSEVSQTSEVLRLLQDCHAVGLEQRDEEEKR
jgi:hypothetical protein